MRQFSRPSHSVDMMSSSLCLRQHIRGRGILLATVAIDLYAKVKNITLEPLIKCLSLGNHDQVTHGRQFFAPARGCIKHNHGRGFLARLAGFECERHQARKEQKNLSAALYKRPC